MCPSVNNEDTNDATIWRPYGGVVSFTIGINSKNTTGLKGPNYPMPSRLNILGDSYGPLLGNKKPNCSILFPTLFALRQCYSPLWRWPCRLA